MDDLYLQQVGDSQIHHEQNGLLSFLDVHHKHPQSQQVSQQPRQEDDAVHHGIHVVLVHPKSLAALAAVVHLQPAAVSVQL